MLIAANLDETPQPAALATSCALSARLRIEFVAEADWEAQAAGFDGICQEQIATFARHRWPGMARETIVFHDGDRAVGGCLILIKRLPLNISAIAIAKWGPVLARAVRPGDAALYGPMIDALMEEYAVRRRMVLSVLPRASAVQGCMECEALIDRGFQPGTPLPFPDRYLVNLQLDADAQLLSFEQKWRYHLKKSQKAELVFELASPAGLPEFDALYRTMLRRKRFADHSAYETAPALMEMQVEALRPSLFLARHRGRAVAGALVFTAGDEAAYLYGATADDALTLRAGYFLQWNIICWLKQNKRARWYDLGGTDGFSGLHQFKKGMVGSAGVIAPIPPAASYAAYLMPRLIGKAAFAARDLANAAQRTVENRRPGGARRDLDPGTNTPPRGNA